MARVAERRAARFCACGKQWFGRYAVLTNTMLAQHLTQCGPLVTAQTFRALGHVIRWPPTWTDRDCREAERSAGQSAERGTP